MERSTLRVLASTESPQPSKQTRRALAAAVAIAATVCGHVAEAYNGVVLETVSDYTRVSNGSTINNTDANTEGAGFWNAMTVSSTWQAQIWFEDASVFDTDFYDPDLTGGQFDNDTNNFDPIGAGLSYFIGHGFCDDITNTACTSDANCGANAYCPNFPLSGQTAACIIESPRTMWVSSYAAQHNNQVTYGAKSTNPQPLALALGEDANSGSWAGVGTNGSTNIAIITNSCGMRFRYRTQDQNRFFAGVHEVMMNMPVGNIHSSPSSSFSDTLQWSARGSTLANLILTNVNAPASSAWLTPSFTNNNYSGAGANIISAFDSTATAVTSRMSGETWAQSTSETRDATSGAVGTYWYTCNFSNCSSYNL
jgi:hypothetical protein